MIGKSYHPMDSKPQQVGAPSMGASTQANTILGGLSSASPEDVRKQQRQHYLWMAKDHLGPGLSASDYVNAAETFRLYIES